MVILVFVCVVTALLAVAYAGFTTGVLCASDKHLRLVFVRVMALLGVIAMGGACVMALRAESPAEDAEEMMEQLTDVEALLAVEEEYPPVILECGVDQNPHRYFPTEAELASFRAEFTVPRPDWVDASVLIKEGGEHWISVSSGPWITDVEAKTALQDEVFKAVAEYVDDQVGRRNAARRIRLTMDDIRLQGVVVEKYAEEEEFAVGPMHLEHAKLVFTQHFRASIAERWQQHLVATRLVKTCVGVGVVMCLLFIAFGVFRRLGASSR